MSILPVNDWKDEFAAIPLVVDQTWKSNWGNWLFDMVSKAGGNAGMALNGWAPPTAFNFQFDKSTFISSLADDGDGLANIAGAFEASVLTSTMVITAPMGTPPMDAIASSAIDVASVSIAKAMILATDVSGMPEDPKDATIITSIRDAFLSLTYTVIGTTGGNPITHAAQGVV